MNEPEKYSCPFCNIWEDKEARIKEVLMETEHCVCLLGLHGNEGSGPTFLVISKEHCENLYDIPNEILVDAFKLAKRVALLIKSAFKVDGTTIWQHNEPAGNQDVWHFHIHIKGRLDNDSLYKKTGYRLPEVERKKLSSMFREASNNHRHCDS